MKVSDTAHPATAPRSRHGVNQSSFQPQPKISTSNAEHRTLNVELKRVAMLNHVAVLIVVHSTFDVQCSTFHNSAQTDNNSRDSNIMKIAPLSLFPSPFIFSPPHSALCSSRVSPAPASRSSRP